MWGEVIFTVKRTMFVSRWCCKSDPLNVVGQFSHDVIGAIKAKLTNHVQRTRFITSSTDKHHPLDFEDDLQSPTTVLFRTTLTRTTTLYELLIPAWVQTIFYVTKISLISMKMNFEGGTHFYVNGFPLRLVLAWVSGLLEKERKAWYSG